MNMLAEEAGRATYATERSQMAVERALQKDIDRIAVHEGRPTHREVRTGRTARIVGVHKSVFLTVDLENINGGAGGMLTSQVVGHGASNVWEHSLKRDLSGRYSDGIVEAWIGVAKLFQGQKEQVD